MAAAALRLDQALATAYRTDWVAQRFIEKQRNEGSLFGCGGCWRLPSEAWVWTSTFTGGIAIILLLAATFTFHLLHLSEPDPNDSKDEQASHREQARGLRQLILWAGLAVGVTALVDSVFRYRAASGHGQHWLVAGTAAFAAALLLLGVMVVAIAADMTEAEKVPHTLIQRIGRFLFRQRVSVLGLALLAAALIAVDQTSGQAIDSIRTWGFTSTHAIARMGFGIAGIMLLSLVVYEAAVRLTAVTREDRKVHKLPGKAVFGIAVGLCALGLVFVVVGPFGYGLLVLATLALAVWLLDRGKLAEPDTQVEEEGEEYRYDARVAEILAIVPLLLFATTGVAAAIDAGLSRGGASSLVPLIPTGILAAAAVLMTGEEEPNNFVGTSWRAFVIAVVVVIVAAVLVLALTSELGAAVLAVLSTMACFAYAVWLFRFQPRTRRDWPVFSLPAALAVGLATFVAIHWNVFGSTETLGTLTLVSIAAASWLASLNYLVQKSFFISAPRALYHIGVRQLPILTLLALAWIATGLLSPPTLHEARLTARVPIQVAGDREVILPTPTLAQAFSEWVASQPELRATVSSRPDAIPMFLVAAHGGGIRAAYWTALALDCLVGVSNAAFDASDLDAKDDDIKEQVRRSTCQDERRAPAEQQAAARRIFIASGVSGGAVGIYAYARQLISTGSLEDGRWVDDKLGHDFASSTMGWALFHDVTNRVLGLHSDRGGGCGWSIGSVCFTADRAAIEEEAFDRVWPDRGFEPLLRLTWDMRSSRDAESKAIARTVPVLLTNTIVTGGIARGVVSALNLGAWPSLDARDPERGNINAYPLAGTVEVVEAVCPASDLRLSTAAILGARFPYVSPAGHLSGHCRRSSGESLAADKASACATVKASVCEMRLVDGGYADNSGLFTLDAVWPSLRQLVMDFNETSDVKIAPVIVELDNHYRARLETELSAGGASKESLVPVSTAFGARNSLETFARALAYRLRPPGCTVTISPSLHPGLTAPLGWELSASAREDLREGLTRPESSGPSEEQYRAVIDLRRLQGWFGRGDSQPPALLPEISACIPVETPVNGP
jgi:hypothetical protein